MGDLELTLWCSVKPAQLHFFGIRQTLPCATYGESAVIKPASETPLTALRLAELATEEGTPSGVCNAVTVQGHTAGSASGGSPAVRKVSFTGSTAVSKTVVITATQNLT
ncbi:aldehyde dehydrogenase family protein [Pokkaliibacter plantistimulans]|uniref:aldehyde dehydrogenase family protein n=1 Tax=Pokkaliibacter plantistimulans TaxID=1635171 RepID=UPI001A9C672D|nr:aldehyde dehydrogenase family protein [Pokkaliibacter plantistimulans]